MGSRSAHILRMPGISQRPPGPDLSSRQAGQCVLAQGGDYNRTSFCPYDNDPIRGNRPSTPMDDRGRNGSWQVALEKVIGEPLNEDLKFRGSPAQVLHEAFFSLNAEFAVTFAVLAFAYRG